ncbi:MAG: hypothetical protein KVP17_003224 [Porospora cf. gigantea B]|uniref:uncharacterized protein n=1 Tax=Porospora cf. gigantea B TaxID=2853592 RepID=UPI003571CA88|nr:MAG: hypothetical protein KVP17_003224 [Porospora cf. gigantea B]
MNRAFALLALGLGTQSPEFRQSNIFIVCLKSEATSSTADSASSIASHVEASLNRLVRREVLHHINAVAFEVHDVRASELESITKLLLESHTDVDFVEVDSIVDEISPRHDAETSSFSDDTLKQMNYLTAAHVEESWRLLGGLCYRREALVTVIDSGIDRHHPALSESIYINELEKKGVTAKDDDHNNYVDDVSGFNMHSNDGNVEDFNGHGTHVAGIILATTSVPMDCSDEKPNIRLLPCKFLGKDGYGTVLNAVRCIDYAIHMGAEVINNSWGSRIFSPTCQRAIERAQTAGILIVSAAGNYTVDMDKHHYYPGSYKGPSHVVVAATDNQHMADFSNYGAETVTLGAPGIDILSSVPGGSMQRFSGTSQSAPIVSGVAVLLRMAHPKLKSSEIKFLLERGCDPSAAGPFVHCGGILNASSSLRLALQLANPD